MEPCASPRSRGDAWPSFPHGRGEKPNGGGRASAPSSGRRTAVDASEERSRAERSVGAGALPKRGSVVSVEKGIVVPFNFHVEIEACHSKIRRPLVDTPQGSQ